MGHEAAEPIIDLTADDAPVWFAGAGAQAIDLTAGPAHKVGGGASLKRKRAEAAKDAGSRHSTTTGSALATQSALAEPPDVRSLLNCPICWDTYLKLAPFVTLCGHHGHEKCFKAWLKPGRMTCPKCAGALPATSSFHPLYLT